MAVHTDITQEYLKECVSYDEYTGEFRWKVRPKHHFNKDRVWKMWNTSYSGKVAGYTNHRTDMKREGFSYRVIRIDYNHYKAHRLAYLYVYGYMPDLVDHINNDPMDNRIENLRPATNSQNGHNRKDRILQGSGIRKRMMTSGYPRFKVAVNCEGKIYTSSGYRSLEEAKWIYNIVVDFLFGEYADRYETSFIPPKDYFLDGVMFTRDLPELKKKVEEEHGWEKTY